MPSKKNIPKEDVSLMYDPTHDDIYRIDKETGETHRYRQIPENSIILSPEEQKRRADYGKQKEKAHQQELQKLFLQIYGRKDKEKHFVFYNISDPIPEISHENLLRSIVLGTYTNYDSKALYLTERTPMKLSDIEKLLGVSAATKSRFWAEVKDNWFSKDESGNLYVCENIFFRGNLKVNSNAEYQKIFRTSIRNLYATNDSKQHGKIGRMLKMLKYLNYEYNILCHNPDEKKYELIRPLSFIEFCKFVGYHVAQASRYVSEYEKIVFPTDETSEKLCCFVGDPKFPARSHIFINPKIVYKGTDPAKLSEYGADFNT